MVEHTWQNFVPIHPGPPQDLEEDWSVELHTKGSPTDAYGTIDFQDSATRGCRAKVSETTESIQFRNKIEEHKMKYRRSADNFTANWDKKTISATVKNVSC